ncbi:rare lipoprotein A-like double-psi beta-barrel protein [Rhizoctonia solani 123E]|uniref:Rare lipoprotein A-like double-psi beta-barrel protein n=1 Tax=Rhizoctonia solani 123E TaxID=1423351 RepID=A0A074SLL1_9AGAM|nr:rare lipoprotein A-like double-psi beta-barrel protein [Rhizoctonia solani 123E]
MFSTVVTAFVLAASVSQVAATPSRARHMYAARAYAQDSHLLEDYDTYHSRYVKIGCIAAKKNDTGFFKDCCHPLSKDADSSVPAKCTGSESDPATPPAASPAPTEGSGSGKSYSGGFATYFYQNGVPGACGKVHSDNDYIVAVDFRQYGDLGKTSDLCGKKLRITNKSNGKTVDCTVADACPTCANPNSLDLSEGAFKALDALDTGMFEMSYTYL